MEELNIQEIENVAGADSGAVAACLAVGSFGARLGAFGGPWGGLAGGVVGCGVGVGLYMFANQYN
ncbi:hypothetical protein [Janthinobacterium sp.]|uniref:hypothetical protein n=1 Tax=Janthinobacterium sp. TaxID=1871054 RepID=UPI002618EF29|nr:hypothetical protein [Janthinobacterium sp.]